MGMLLDATKNPPEHSCLTSCSGTPKPTPSKTPAKAKATPRKRKGEDNDNENEDEGRKNCRVVGEHYLMTDR